MGNSSLAYYKINKEKENIITTQLKSGTPLEERREFLPRLSLSLSLFYKSQKDSFNSHISSPFIFLFSLLVLVISNFQSYVSGTHKFLSFFFHLVKQINPSNLAFPFRCLISCFSFVICCVYVWFFRAVSYLIYSGLKSKFDQFNNHFRFSHSLSICSRHFLF